MCRQKRRWTLWQFLFEEDRPSHYSICILKLYNSYLSFTSVLNYRLFRIL